jgi:hypothetical protein
MNLLTTNNYFTLKEIGVKAMIISVKSEVLTAVVKRSSIIWNITPCSPLKVNRRFEGDKLSSLPQNIDNLNDISLPADRVLA